MDLRLMLAGMADERARGGQRALTLFFSLRR
jgi:hypothetical protein